AAFLPWNKVEHLFPNGLVQDKINVVDVKSLTFSLDETQQIIAFPDSIINDVPESFDDILKVKVVKGEKIICPLEFAKKSHHRQLCEKFMDGTPLEKPAYLTEFLLPVRFEEAL